MAKRKLRAGKVPSRAPLPFPDIEGYRVLYLPLAGAVLAGLIAAYRWVWERAVAREISS